MRNVVEHFAELLLADDEPPAFEIVNASGASKLVLVCDHASKCVPRCLDSLGLTSEQLDDHIGWDPGAANVARLLSKNLDAPLILSGYSRLVIDCNRPLQSSQSIPAQSAGILIPRNQNMTDEDRVWRVNHFFLPYHHAIDALLAARKNIETVFLSIHSFTPILNGAVRPWDIGVSYWRDNRLAKLLIDALKKVDGFEVGDNEPYAIDADYDYAVPVHGEGRGLPSAMIEIRQDGLRSALGVETWATHIAHAYKEIERSV